MGAERHRTVRRIRAIQNINPGRDRVEASERGQSGHTTGRAQRPSLERPSLFAGMDDSCSPKVNGEGVRILSTLESASKVQGRPRLGAKPSGHGARWALWSLVGAGLATAGAALWMAQAPATPAPAVVNATALPPADQRAMGTKALAPQTAPPTVPQPAASQPFASLASAAAPTATVASAAVTGPVSAPNATTRHATTPLAALIENTPPAAGPTVLNVAPPAAPTSSAAASKVASKAAPQNAEATPKKAAVAKPKARKERSTKDRDVELLEAVMSHTERRPSR